MWAADRTWWGGALQRARALVSFGGRVRTFFALAGGCESEMHLAPAIARREPEAALPAPPDLPDET